MQQVKDWLAGSRNFITGRAIYKAFGKDQQLIELLERGQTVYSIQQLVIGMEALIGGQTEPHPAHDTTSTPKAAVSAPTATREAFMPDGGDLVLQAIKAEWMPLYKKMQYLIAQLDKYGDRNDDEAISYRNPIAAEILELEERVNRIWQKRDHYLQHGELLSDKKRTVDIPKDPLKLATLINQIKRNIRTNRQMMKKQPGKPVYAKKYLSYKLQYQQVTGKQYQEVDNE